MATYFHGSTSEIPSSAEGLQTLYLMNPNYVPYSDAAQHPTQNMLLVNPNNNNTSNTSPTSTNALNLGNFSHAPPPPSPNNNNNHREQQQHHLIGVTIPSSNILGSNAAATDPARSSFLGQHEFSSFHGGAAATSTVTASRGNYNLWGSIIDQSALNIMAATTHTPSSNMGCVASSVMSTQIGFHRPNHLSLSLSSQQTPYRSLSGEIHAISPASRGGGGDDMRGLHNGVSSMHSVALGSKYLKATQELLDEVVNVGKGISKGEESMEGAKKEKMKGNIESTSGVGDGSSCGRENNDRGKQGVELSTAQRQELQMKKSKLVTMLDEVEQRYRQYHHQMQVVLTSFEQAAGVGAAKSYTALALKTISKQFRCLKDAISSQIKTTSKTLGEDNCLGVKVEGSRLRYVDHQQRQQRALQLGMIQHNAWRPQRGLPERAVSVLRAWLFEHFLHPYPKDSDKVMLAKQTGLTRSQVSNWFINARVRLWKPMVEEMYLEEVKQEPNNSSQDNNNTKGSNESSKELWSEANAAAQESGAMRFDQINILQSKAESFKNNQTTSPTEISNSNSLQSGFHLADMQSPNKPKSTSEMHQNSPGSILSVDMEMKPHHHGETNNITREGQNNNTTTKFGIESHGGGFGAFPNMEDIGRFHHHVTEQLAPRFHGNGVSLTLGLPHSTENNLSLSGTTQHGFLSQNMHLGMRNSENDEFCGAINTTPPSSHSGISYESIDIQNRKRFAAQLLRDFVA